MSDEITKCKHQVAAIEEVYNRTLSNEDLADFRKNLKEALEGKTND